MSKTVLVVDDSGVSRQLIVSLIRSQYPEWRTVEARDGADALRRAAQCQPTLITLDVNMPQMDGFEAAVHLRQMLPDSTLVLLTGNIQAPSRASVDDLNVHYLAKPITPMVIYRVMTLWAEEQARRA